MIVNSLRTFVCSSSDYSVVTCWAADWWSCCLALSISGCCSPWPRVWEDSGALVRTDGAVGTKWVAGSGAANIAVAELIT